MVNTQDLVDAGFYDDETAVIQDSLRYLLQARPELRLELAIYQFQNQEISLSKAANLAGMSFVQMKEIMYNRGIALRLGPETKEDAQNEVNSLRKYSNVNLGR